MGCPSSRKGWTAFDVKAGNAWKIGCLLLLTGPSRGQITDSEGNTTMAFKLKDSKHDAASDNEITDESIASQNLVNLLFPDSNRIVIQRLYRPAGRFEGRHQQNELHLWFRATGPLSEIGSASVLLRSRSNFVSKANDYQPASLISEQVGRFSPNDPIYPNQDLLRDIGIERAWGRTLGDPRVVVAIIDSGYDFRHPDLLGCDAIYCVSSAALCHTCEDC
eukprot:6194196-Pleurochrysis_carterae.AAC.3